MDLLVNHPQVSWEVLDVALAGRRIHRFNSPVEVVRRAASNRDAAPASAFSLWLGSVADSKRRL